jgi:ATP-dependent RNA helicase UAP56/SUB2
MSGHDNEELVSYEEEEDLVATSAPAIQNGAAEKDKKYAGIHSTGFRFAFLLLISVKSNSTVATSC